MEQWPPHDGQLIDLEISKATTTRLPTNSHSEGSRMCHDRCRDTPPCRPRRSVTAASVFTGIILPLPKKTFLNDRQLIYYNILCASSVEIYAHPTDRGDWTLFIPQKAFKNVLSNYIFISVQTYFIFDEAVRNSVQSISQIFDLEFFNNFFIFQPYSYIFIIELSNLFSNQFTNKNK